MIIISTVITIALWIIIFGIVVVVHELGHFLAARKNNILVEEFAIGMGPKLYSFHRKDDPTLYSLRMLPIGGFCKMLGDDEEAPDNPQSFNRKKVSQRMSVMLAGAVMNFILAFLICFFILSLNGILLPSVQSTVEGMPAALAGLKAGDRITHINGSRVRTYDDFSFGLSINGSNPIDLRVVRDGQHVDLNITPYADEHGIYRVGFYPESRVGWMDSSDDGGKRVGIWEGIYAAFYRIIFWVKATIIGLIRLISGAGSVADIAGPIGFGAIIGETYRSSIAISVSFTVFRMLNLCALLSASLGVFNLLPLPALDGGRIVFLIFEGIRRKPILSQEREGMVHFVGFVLLMILAAFVFSQDILKLI